MTAHAKFACLLLHLFIPVDISKWRVVLGVRMAIYLYLQKYTAAYVTYHIFIVYIKYLLYFQS